MESSLLTTDDVLEKLIIFSVTNIRVHVINIATKKKSTLKTKYIEIITKKIETEEFRNG